MTINISNIKALDLLSQAMAREQNKKAAEEQTKLGRLRGGNSGAILPGTTVAAGACARLAHLRMLGVELEVIDDSKLLMFQGGFQNENVWVSYMRDIWPGKVKVEDEIPISWETSTGIKVTGRPDLVLCDPNTEVPVLGFELKGVASVWTLRDIWTKDDSGPKLAHICQAAHYSWKLGEQYNIGKPLPYKIIYTSYVNFSMPDFARKFFPPPGYVESRYIEYNEKGEVKNTKPQAISYDIIWDGDQVKFRREDADDRDPWTPTPVTWRGIQKFYEVASGTDLGPRPATLTAAGGRQNYSICGYCSLNEVCGKYEKSGWQYDRWLQDARRAPRR